METVSVNLPSDYPRDQRIYQARAPMLTILPMTVLKHDPFDPRAGEAALKAYRTWQTAYAERSIREENRVFKLDVECEFFLGKTSDILTYQNNTCSSNWKEIHCQYASSQRPGGTGSRMATCPGKPVGFHHLAERPGTSGRRRYSGPSF